MGIFGQRSLYLQALTGFIFVVAFIYLLNVFGTLRLNGDAIILLSAALSSMDGGGRLFHGQPILYPPGYPFMVELLLATGAASQVTLVLLNLVFLLIGLACFVLLLRACFGFSQTSSIFFAGLVMLNWAYVKHTPLPLTDMPFFGIAFLSLWVIERARTARSDHMALRLFFLGWILILTAIGIRRVGISLAPVWIAALATRPGWRQRMACASGRMKVLIIGILLPAFGALIAWFFATSTLQDYPETLSAGGVGQGVITSLLLRATEAGEVILNIPGAKIPAVWGNLLVIAGASAFALALAGLVRRWTLGVCEIYSLSYAAIMIAWPLSDSRLLIPVIPFLLAYAFIGAQSLGRGPWIGRLCVGWVILYAAAGLAALLYSARITFSGPHFPMFYGDGALRPTYCAFLKSCPVESPPAINSDALRILETFQSSRHSLAPVTLKGGGH